MFRSLDFVILILPALLNRHFEIFGKDMETNLYNQLRHAINNHLTG
jgi:hypothetical protein